MRRRHAEHRQRHVARRAVDLQRDERARAAGQRFRRRSEQPCAREVQLADAALDELALRRAGAHDDRAATPICVSRFSSSSPSSPCHSPPPTRSATTTIAAPAAADRSVDPDTCGREAFDRRRLRDVERLAGGHASRLVDQPDRRARRRGARARARARRRARRLRRWRPRCIGATIVMAVMRTMQVDLRGKVAIVTGGSRGIGLAIARALVAEGVQVAVTGRSEAHLSAARPQIEARRARRRRDAAGRRPPLRRGRARDRRDGRALRRPRHPRQQRRRRHLRRRRRHDAGAVGRGDRHEPDRRLQRVSRGAAAPARSAAAASSSTSAAWPARTRSRAAPRTARRRPG